jgi:hypothetical protein
VGGYARVGDRNRAKKTYLITLQNNDLLQKTIPTDIAPKTNCTKFQAFLLYEAYGIFFCSVNSSISFHN